MTSSHQMETKETCVVCLEPITENDRHELKCKHIFHKACIERWIELRNLCPLCNKQADPERPVKELEDDDDILSRDAIRMLLSRQNDSRSSLLGDLLFGTLMSNIVPNQIISQTAGRMRRTGTLSSTNLPEIFISSFDISTPAQNSQFRTTTTGLQSNSQNPLHLLRQLRSSRFPSHSSTSQSSNQSNRTSIISSSSPSSTSTNLNNNNNNRNNNRNNSRNRQPLTGFRFEINDHDQSEQPCVDVQCAACGSIKCIHDIRRCSGCHEIRYCNETCQTSHWPVHQKYCKGLK